MKKNHRKHFLSLAIIVAFIFLASSSAVNKLHMGAFNYNNKVEDTANEGNYLLLNNGNIIKGEKIGWQSGLLSNHKIKIDNQKFASKEVRGYRKGDEYFARLGDEYIQRIVHGPKINVYVQFTDVTSQSTTGSSRTYTRTDYYAQKGEDGPLVAFGSQKKIKELVADCPLAVEMADKSDKEIRHAIKKNRNYLNSIFEVYNNNCRE